MSYKQPYEKSFEEFSKLWVKLPHKPALGIIYAYDGQHPDIFFNKIVDKSPPYNLKDLFVGTDRIMPLIQKSSQSYNMYEVAPSNWNYFEENAPTFQTLKEAKIFCYDYYTKFESKLKRLVWGSMLKISKITTAKNKDRLDFIRELYCGQKWYIRIKKTKR